MDQPPFDSSRLSSYFRELAETSKPAIRPSELPSEFHRACGPWVSVTAAAAKVAFAFAHITPAGAVVDLVLALGAVDNAQTELLKSIKADTLLLRQEPLHTAVTFMSEAERVGLGDERWAQFLNSALDNLYRAKSLAVSSEEQAVVQFGLACAYLTLDKPPDARHWIEEAVKSERRTVNSLVPDSEYIQDSRPPESRVILAEDFNVAPSSIVSNIKVGAWLAATYFGMRVPIPGPKGETIRRRVEPLRPFFQFVNSVEICAAIICGQRETNILLLEQQYMYELSEVPLVLPVAG
jgi:hypothetical protein